MGANSWIEKLAHRAGRRARNRLAGQANYEFLARHGLFQELEPPAFLYLYNHMIERRYKRHEIIFKEGNPGICLFIVKSGRVEVFTQNEEDPSSSRTIYTTLGEGALFGELSLIALSYRTCSARAVESGTDLITFSLYDMQTIHDQFPRDGIRLMKAMAKAIGSHLVNVDRRLAESLREIEQLKQKLAKHE